MIIGDDAAGKAAVEVLIDKGKLTPDFWFRVYENHKSHNPYARNDPCNKQVENAVKFAMGLSGVEPPDWAGPDYVLPTWTWIPEYDQSELPTTEPYHTVKAMQATLAKCYNGPTLDKEDQKIQDGVFRSLSLRAWRRIIPHFSIEVSEKIIEIENWPNTLYGGHTRKRGINDKLRGLMIRDSALYEFYEARGSDGLSLIFHGLGKRAVLGVGAMLFHSGEHDDLLYTAEQLEDILSRDK